MKRSARLMPKGFVRKFAPGSRVAPGQPRWFPGLDLGPRKIGERGPNTVASLGRIGGLETRLARTVGELRKAQHIRYHVFYEEMAAVPDARMRATRRDFDDFDPICDHLLVLDHDVGRRKFRRHQPEVVGTYRLLRQEIADLNDGFYTADEFEIQSLIERHQGLRFMELGRSCVLKPYRNKRTVELLWHGIWSYVLMHDVDVMFGCASLEGTDPDRLATALSFLHHHCSAPPDWSVRALDERRVPMDRIDKSAIDAKAALRELPPLIKGYLRLGAYIGDGAVIDHQFGTTDVIIILPVSAISERYINFYGVDASRYS